MSAARCQHGYRIESGAHANAPAPLTRPGADAGATSSDATPAVLTAAEVARLWRDTMKDKSYRAFRSGFALAITCGRSGVVSPNRRTATTRRASTSSRGTSPISTSPTSSRQWALSVSRSSATTSGARGRGARSTRRSRSCTTSFGTTSYAGTSRETRRLRSSEPRSATFTVRRSRPRTGQGCSPRTRTVAIGSPSDSCSTTASARGRYAASTIGTLTTSGGG